MQGVCALVRPIAFAAPLPVMSLTIPERAITPFSFRPLKVTVSHQHFAAHLGFEILGCHLLESFAEHQNWDVSHSAYEVNVMTIMYLSIDDMSAWACIYCRLDWRLNSPLNSSPDL
ncbi:hypothetical protein C7974DRAFT_95754 [Boeremia exigua]|uniref:uncharacterized protein n=1 Tax=Boeremia exigua TaxID=749465 RepID=UPI001E8DF5F4|nr:uncharacterized protein C7974DRAFT_95754 [Boeremia exigua]KAH6642131.1 hypothetical protein C7974DRAFT_95754 [Boeremia exigua]